jgi:hypothetical protein
MEKIALFAVGSNTQEPAYAGEPWGGEVHRNSLYYNELAIFSGKPSEVQPGFSEAPFIFTFFFKMNKMKYEFKLFGP